MMSSRELSIVQGRFKFYLKGTIPWINSTLYAYDLADHVTQTKANSAAQPLTIVSDASYEPFGPLAGFTWGNGLALSIQYDQDYRPSTLLVQLPEWLQNRKI
jgi:hypothetical protein